MATTHQFLLNPVLTHFVAVLILLSGKQWKAAVQINLSQHILQLLYCVMLVVLQTGTGLHSP